MNFLFPSLLVFLLGSRIAQLSETISEEELANKLFLLINFYRWRQNKAQLKLNPVLSKFAKENNQAILLQKEVPNPQKAMTNYSLRSMSISKDTPLDNTATLQMYSELRVDSVDSKDAPLDAGISIERISNVPPYKYHITFLRARPIPDFLKLNLNSDQREVAVEIFALMNEVRKKEHLTTLLWDTNLQESTLQHSIYMAQTQKLSHEGYEKRVQGYYLTSENVAELEIQVLLPPKEVASQIFN